MSKSLGNFFTIRELLKEYHPEILRYFLLSSHYRSPLNYDLDALKTAEQSLRRLYQALSVVPEYLPTVTASSYHQRFIEVMSDDFNTPNAMAVLFELSHLIHKAESETEKQQYAAILKTLGGWLGLLQQSPTAFLQHAMGEDAAVTAEWIESQIAARHAARQQKDWALADTIRDELLKVGIVLEDKAGVTTWTRNTLRK